MSADDLALRFSSAPAEQLIGVLPVLEVKEALRSEVEEEVDEEVFLEHRFEMEAVEEDLERITQEAGEFKDAANQFATVIRLALTLPESEARNVLNDVLEDNPGYGRNP